MTGELLHKWHYETTKFEPVARERVASDNEMDAAAATTTLYLSILRYLH